MINFLLTSLKLYALAGGFVVASIFTVSLVTGLFSNMGRPE